MASPISMLRQALRSSWLRQGTWSVLDQAFFAGANFLVNVLLARWLSPEAYGAFTVAFVVFLLAGTIHGGMLIEPMLVFGRGRFEGRTAAYLRVLLRAHLGYAAVAGVVLGGGAAICWALGATGFAALFGTLAVAQGAILVLWLMRRACYLVSRPSWAASAGFLYLVLLTASAVGLYRVDALTGASALGLMAVCSVVASAVLAVRLGVFRAEATPDLARDATAAHIEYGRWAASTGVLEWAQLAVPFLVLPVFVGLEGSATLRALFNLAMPAAQGFGALATMCLPVLVQARLGGTFRSKLKAIGGGFVGLGLAYGVVVVALGGPAVEWLYGGAYSATPGMLVALALVPVTVAISNVLTTAVRSAERPSAVFRARVWALGVTATVGVGLTAVLGVLGALIGEIVMLLAEIGALLMPAREAARSEAEVGEEPPAAPRPNDPPPTADGPAPPVEVSPTLESAWT